MSAIWSVCQVHSHQDSHLLRHNCRRRSVPKDGLFHVKHLCALPPSRRRPSQPGILAPLFPRSASAIAIRRGRSARDSGSSLPARKSSRIRVGTFLGSGDIGRATVFHVKQETEFLPRRQSGLQAADIAYDRRQVALNRREATTTGADHRARAPAQAPVSPETPTRSPAAVEEEDRLLAE